MDIKRLSLLLVVLTFTLAGCASNNTQPVYVNGTEIKDPMEEYNRAVFRFNDYLDETLLEPVARGYKYITPDFAERGIRNALDNIRSPLYFGNQLLQADFEGALDVLMRAMINTTFGVLGFVDLAADAGIEKEKEDFGQTLAVWGVDHGPYFVVPLYGPGTIRDHLASAGESFVNPVRIYLSNIDETEIYYGLVAIDLIDQRARLINVLEDLKESSIDYYAAVRSSYYQNRDALTKDQDKDFGAMPQVPDYSD